MTVGAPLRTLVWLLLSLAGLPLRAQTAVPPPELGPPAPAPADLRLRAEDKASAAQIDAAAAELLRAWLGGAPNPVDAIAHTSSTAALHTLEPWLQYVEAMTIGEAANRERMLRKVSGWNDDPFVRAAVLRAIALDPTVQGRQAEFFRRYGFYANWFNRLFYSAGRALQGNISASMQLIVDAVADIFRPREANAQERRAYALLQRARELQSRRGYDRDALRKLERAVDMAFARADLEQAEWALDHGAPETAAFYADQAAVRRPGWKPAEQLRDAAEIQAAAQRRRALASGQAGYPDRDPPIDLADADLLRAIFADAPLTSVTLPREHAALATLLHELPAPGTGRATLMRDWPARLNRNPKTAPADRAWILAMAQDPAQNPDLRLDNAIETRRGKQLHYIFLGPERARERAYKTATWITQAYNALASIGVFYIFEVGGRAARVVAGSPVPNEEVIDAEAHWLANSIDPAMKEPRQVARDLADRYKDAARYDDARRVLETSGLLTIAESRKLARAEARRLTTVAETLPPGPLRSAYFDRAGTLSLEIASKARKKAEKRDARNRPEAEDYHLTWAGLQQLTRVALPSGLPGSADWFDADGANGEVRAEGFFIRFREGDEHVDLRYAIDHPQRTQVFADRLPLTALPPALKLWLELGGQQRQITTQALNELDRVPIPFSVEAGVGASGFDLYPRLLPLEGRGQTELYQ